jgi:hypothetical protein
LGTFQKNIIKPSTPEALTLMQQFVKSERELILKGIMPIDQYHFPKFICIGAQKAGTTWLFRNLKNHPEVILRQKEFHFFDNYNDQPLSVYSNCFNIRNKKIAGDITPSYCLIPNEQVEFMHRIMPNAKLIFMLRNPIDRAWSGLLMHFFKRKEISEAALSEEKMIAYLKKEPVLNRGLYSKSIKKFLSYYPMDQLLILDFDRVASEPESLLKEVYEYIGVATDLLESKFDPTKKIHARTKDLEMPEKVRAFLEDTYRSELELLSKSHPKIAGKWLEKIG